MGSSCEQTCQVWVTPAPSISGDGHTSSSSSPLACFQESVKLQASYGWPGDLRVSVTSDSPGTLRFAWLTKAGVL